VLYSYAGFIRKLAWEPSFACKPNSLIKVSPLNLEFLNQAKNIPAWVYQVIQTKFEANRSNDSQVIIELTNTSTEITILYIHIIDRVLLYASNILN